jgi:hypothetical protein
LNNHPSNSWLFSLGIWLFYAAFIILGVGVGLIVGFFLANIVVFAIFGFIIGLGLGILTNAILVTIKYFRNHC